MLLTHIHEVEFNETPISNYSSSEAHQHDITLGDIKKHADKKNNTQITSQAYCKGLLKKLSQISNTQLRSFVHYQCQQCTAPLTWLSAFEELVELNHAIFEGPELNLKREKLMVIVEFVRADIENNKLKPANKFDFAKVKAKLKTLQNYQEQKIYLLEIKADYLQNKPRINDANEVPFDKKVDIEMDKINQLEINEKPEKTKKLIAKLSEEYMDNQDFIILFKISKRTSRHWRECGYIPFYKIGAKVYFKTTDVEKLLQDNYFKSLR